MAKKKSEDTSGRPSRSQPVDPGKVPVLPNLKKRQDAQAASEDPEKTQRVKHQDVLDEWFK
jgi:hypothetical protein